MKFATHMGSADSLDSLGRSISNGQYQSIQMYIIDSETPVQQLRDAEFIRI